MITPGFKLEQPSHLVGVKASHPKYTRGGDKSSTFSGGRACPSGAIGATRSIGIFSPNKPIFTLPLDSAGSQFCSQANQRLHVKESAMSSSISFVAYYRVSTARQGMSGLGLEAQRAATSAYLTANGGNLLAEITEVESGKKNRRPELKAAIEMCRKTGSTLLIAKLDRLARNVAFIANLLESGVRFVAVDMPNADRFMLHVYAAMAEEEGRRISERTKAALASAKLRGVRLGKNGKMLANLNASAADARARAVGPDILRLHDQDGLSYRAIAEVLNRRPGGESSARWHSTSVYRMATRYRRLSTSPCITT